ncbi:MAG: xanthine dehydrogenase family protein subunit M [Deltaproteobacteria bacterium]|nr:xanthine dehydrogenase family protein subunit M [Deltaproteobacteria bacterium]
MSNSQVITHDFDYYSPKSVTEALDILKMPGTRALAGGTDVLNEIKTGGDKPGALVYIMGIKELDFLVWEGGLKIGATTLFSTLEEDQGIREKYPALHDAVKSMGAVQIKNLATPAGNLCTASPGADSAPPLMALNAQVEISTKNEKGEIERRNVRVEDFFTGPRKTVLQPGELITAISIPEPSPESGSAFRKIARVTLSIAKINCAVYVVRDGDTCAEVRAALGGVAPKPVRASNFEKALAGQKLSESSLARAAEALSEDISPRNARSTAAYKRHAASFLIRDVFEAAWERSGGEVAK